MAVMHKSKSKKILGVLTFLIMIFSIFSLSGCGDDKKVEEPKKDLRKKRKRTPRKNTSKKKTSKSSSKGTSSNTRANKKRKGPVKVDNLVIKNPERIEDLLKAKEYGYNSKFNIFRDYVIRERERIDTDKDGIPDIYDPDDDNDRFPDVQEIAEGFDPLNKYSHPVSNIIGGDAGAINQPMATNDSGTDSNSKTNKKQNQGRKNASSTVDQPIVESQTAGVYFRGLFGIRNNKVAVLKVVKDKKDNIILRREGEKFAGIAKDSEYLLEEINLVQEFIKVRDLEKDNLIKLSFQKDKKAKKKSVQPVETGKKSSTKSKVKKSSKKKKNIKKK